MTQIYLLGAGIIIIWILASVRIISDRERLAIYRLSKFIGFRGPGIIFTLLGIDRCTKIRIGDTGVMASSDTAEIKGVKIPVQSNDPLYVTDPIIIDKFTNSDGIKAVAKKSMEGSLSNK